MAVNKDSLFYPGFQPVPEDEKIDTAKFLEACDKIPGFFELMGGMAFRPVKADVVGNIEKIRKRFLSKPMDFQYLDDILVFEKTETDKQLKAKDGNGIATNALMWLKRGLKFIVLFLEHLIKGDYDENLENLKSCARLAYEGSLKDYHGWLVSKMVTAATNACPYRKDFLESIATSEGVSVEKVLEIMESFIGDFIKNVDLIYKQFEKHGVEKFHKV